MNTESIKTRRVEEGGMERPGDYLFDTDFLTLYIWLPGNKAPDCIPIQKGSHFGARVWGWDGNIDAPTLTPSIHDIGRWHGWLREGVLQSC